MTVSLCQLGWIYIHHGNTPTGVSLRVSPQRFIWIEGSILNVEAPSCGLGSQNELTGRSKLFLPYFLNENAVRPAASHSYHVGQYPLRL